MRRGYDDLVLAVFFEPELDVLALVEDGFEGDLGVEDQDLVVVWSEPRVLVWCRRKTGVTKR